MSDKALTLADFEGFRGEIKQIQIPRLGGAIWIREITHLDRGELELIGTKDPTRVRAEIFRRCVCDAEGKPLLRDVEEAKRFMKAPAPVLEPLFDQCLQHAGFREKDVEDLEKNS